MIARSISIILETEGSREARDRTRFIFSIYRLYRYLNLSPSEISFLTKIPVGSVKSSIGQVFRELCSKQTQCVFKEYLAPSVRTARKPRNDDHSYKFIVPVE